MLMAQNDRPRFTPRPSLPGYLWEPLKDATGRCDWIPVCSCPADFPVDIFETAVLQLVHHPEYNSTLILRSEIIEGSEHGSGYEGPTLQGFRFVKNIRRKLLPRRPGRDPPIEQDCALYAASSGAIQHDVHGSILEDEAEVNVQMPVNCLVLTPKLEEGVPMPYYHPAVFHIAFRYLYSSSGDATKERGDKEAQLRIEVVLQPSAPDPKDINSRLYRTCLSLLETVHRYGWGALANYRKQVHHDCLVSREEYQDLYLIMRERHKYNVDQWHENTDPLKHVFEDIGIATFLMLLWKQDTSEMSISTSDVIKDKSDIRTGMSDRMPWHTWPRPRGGFLDFGCGNGLLVHILCSEGYAGEGIDVRARSSWGYYTAETQAHLHVHSLNPLELPVSTLESTPVISSQFLKPDAFIIANHADELSPWTPVLATLTGAIGFLSIPCCPWSFDAPFHRSQMPLRDNHNSEREVPFTFTPPGDTDISTFVESLRLGGLGGDAGKSKYAAYRVWLACLGVHCGWAAESETLRIPSTRNWALVGRNRRGEDAEANKKALAILHQVRERGFFKTRRPEGKAGEH